MLCKHFLRNRIFSLKDISTFAFGFTNLIMLIIGIAYWNTYGAGTFRWYAFWYGTAGSIINFFGKICVQNACAKGPAGPASAVMSTNCLLLLLFDVIARGKILKPTDIVAIAFGIFGVIMMTLPKYVEALCRTIFCIKKKEQNVDDSALIDKMANNVQNNLNKELKNLNNE